VPSANILKFPPPETIAHEPIAAVACVIAARTNGTRLREMSRFRLPII